MSVTKEEFDETVKMMKETYGFDDQQAGEAAAIALEIYPGDVIMDPAQAAEWGAPKPTEEEAE